ncbi:MAG: 50S ribosomal protein L28, partial [Dehalococcoidia bacterium]
MAKCDICGKRRQFGRNVSHSKRRTRREWKPNIQRATLIINGRPT